MAIATLQGLKPPEAVAVAAEVSNRDAPLQACADKLGGELHLAHHQDLIQQREPHPIKFLLLTTHHELLPLDASGAVGAQ